MKGTLQRRLMLAFTVLVFMALFLMASLFYIYFENFYVNRTIEELQNQAVLIGEILKEEDVRVNFQELAHLAARETKARVTIVSSKGEVLGESDKSPALLENHRNRPEIQAALKGQLGVSRRYSRTIHQDLLYVATPVQFEGKVLLTIRLALPLKEIALFKMKLSFIMFLCFLITGAIGVIMGIFISRRFTRPLIELKNAVWSLSEHNFEHRLSLSEFAEMNELIRAYNYMAEVLKQKMEELSGLSKRLELVINTSINGTLLIDCEDSIKFVNTASAKMLKLDPENDYLGQNFLAVTRIFELASLIEKVKNTLKPCQQEIIIYGQEERVIEVHGIPLEEKGCLSVLLVLNDITQFKHLERVRKDFIANVSHELRTPLAAIRGFAETLLSEDSDSPAVKEFAGVIFTEAIRVERLINGLLELSRLETGNAKLNYCSFSLRDSAEEALRLIENRDSASLTCSVEIEGDALVQADKDLILQVYLNLLENAIKYSEGPVKISVKIADLNDRVRVEVSDRGIGIAKTDQKRIFERFYKVDKVRSRESGGAGLGLSIVRHIIEVHGGKVGVISRLGCGSTLYFEIPKKEEK